MESVCVYELSECVGTSEEAQYLEYSMVWLSFRLAKTSSLKGLSGYSSDSMHSTCAKASFSTT